MLAYATLVLINHDWTVKFPEHLAQLRKERSLTKPQLAEKIGLHIAQIRRYEAGTSQPTLDVIRVRPCLFCIRFAAADGAVAALMF